MNIKNLTFSTAVAILLFGSTTAVAQNTKADFVKDGTSVYKASISEIDSIVFSNPVKGVVSQDVIDLISEEDGFPEKAEFPRKVETVRDTSYTVAFGNQSSIDPSCFAYNVKWDCTKKRISASTNPSDFVMYNPLASVLWPGCLIQGKSLESGVPTIIPCTKRQPGNITLAIVASSSNGAVMYRTVDKMQFSYVNQAMNDILSGFGGVGGAQLYSDITTISSEEELVYELNASFAGYGAAVSTKLKSAIDNKKTMMLVKLYQAYFTMVYDDPAGFDGVFTPDITVNDLKNYTGNGNPVCYISSVTYGRIYYLLYVSDIGEKRLNAALNAAYKGFGVDVSADAKLEFRNVMDSTRCTVFQLGGNAFDGLLTGIAPTFDDIENLMKNGANFDEKNTGLPTSYTVKYLKDASLVRMNNTLDYEVEDCTADTTENICPELPTLTTNNVTSVQGRTARLGGNITNSGYPGYIERGVVYSTSPMPNPDSTNNKTVIMIDGTTATFDTLVSGLILDTTYYVRAFTSNIHGTAYGQERSFITPSQALPELTTNIINITTSGGTFGGNITYAGVPAYTERGVVYALTPNPTIANNKTVVSGTGTGSFNTPPISGLTQGANYYVRAYATSSLGTIYGNEETITVGTIPVLTISAATNIMDSTATLSGSITNTGNPAYTECGFVYGTSSNPTTSNNKIIVSKSGTGSITTPATNLIPNTQYYVRAYVINAGVPTYSTTQVNFTTANSVNLSTVSANGTGYTWASPILTVNSGANLVITGSVSNGRRIEVAANATNVKIILKNVSISGTWTTTTTVLGIPMSVTNYATPMLLNNGANVTLTLVGTNTLTAGSGYAGIQTTGATLTIDGTGSLTATGGSGAAGIGGRRGSNGSSGSSTSDGANGANGCGGKDASNVNSATPGSAGSAGGAAGNITINSGVITAKGGANAVGIGGGNGGNGGDGGTGGNGGDGGNSNCGFPGYGGHGGRGGDGGHGGYGNNGGAGGAGGIITINGGNVTANGGTNAGRDIGGGNGGNGGNGGDGGKGGHGGHAGTLSGCEGSGGNGGNGGNGGDGGNGGASGTITGSSAITGIKGGGTGGNFGSKGGGKTGGGYYGSRVGCNSHNGSQGTDGNNGTKGTNGQ